MKIVDANVLLYAVDERAMHHRTANAWLRRALAGEEAIGFAWQAVLAFVRVSTLHRFAGAISFGHAADLVEVWLSQPAAVIVQATPRHLSVLRGLLEPIGTAGNLVGDAHLAALAIEHGGEMISFDRDFGRFPGLRWSLPPAS